MGKISSFFFFDTLMRTPEYAIGEEIARKERSSLYVDTLIGNTE